jgi:hypothetical protein
LHRPWLASIPYYHCPSNVALKGNALFFFFFLVSHFLFSVPTVSPYTCMHLASIIAHNHPIHIDPQHGGRTFYKIFVLIRVYLKTLLLILYSVGYRRMITEDWHNDTDRGKPRYQCHFTHRKLHGNHLQNCKISQTRRV